MLKPETGLKAIIAIHNTHSVSFGGLECGNTTMNKKHLRCTPFIKRNDL